VGGGAIVNHISLLSGLLDLDINGIGGEGALGSIMAVLTTK
jgi:hypothetical protein